MSKSYDSKFLPTLACLMVGLSISGCASNPPPPPPMGWDKPDAVDAQFAQDKYECIKEASSTHSSEVASGSGEKFPSLL